MIYRFKKYLFKIHTWSSIMSFLLDQDHDHLITPFHLIMTFYPFPSNHDSKPLSVWSWLCNPFPLIMTSAARLFDHDLCNPFGLIMTLSPFLSNHDSVPFSVWSWLCTHFCLIMTLYPFPSNHNSVTLSI